MARIVCGWMLAVGLTCAELFAAPATISVQSFGALGDGKSDDTTAIMQAIRATDPNGGTVFFPEGNYAISGSGIVITRSNVVLEGAGDHGAVLRRIDHAAPLLQSAASNAIQHRLVVRNLCFDGSHNTMGGENTASIALYGDHLLGITISHCEFANSPAVAIALKGTTDVTIDACTFRAPGDAIGTAINLTKSPRDISITGNRFLYVRDGVVIGTGDASNPSKYRAEKLKITNNYFDLGWWLIKEVSAGQGNAVHYTKDSLKDNQAAFKNLLSNAHENVRVMPLKQEGHGTYSNNTVSDPEARFVTNNLRRGDLVRAGENFAVVKGVKSETTLEVEEWLSINQYLPATAPKEGTPYIAYGIILGEIRAFSANTITTTRWWDFDGKSVTPPDGTRYEVLVQRPNYALHAEAGVSDITVSNNVFKRGWSDQVSIYGNRATVTNNVIEDGEDMGITLHGSGHYIANNHISHQGAGGIWANASDSVIEKNQITDSQWVNNANDSWLGDIIIDDGNRNRISENKCGRLSSVLGYNGIVIAARQFGSTGNVVRGNASQGHLKSDIRFTSKSGAKVSATALENNQGKVVR